MLTSMREAAMQYMLMLWHADHLKFGQLLNLLESQLQRVHDGGSPDYELMLDIMYYMTHYSDVLHHPKEDLVFAVVKARAPDFGDIVDDLTRQHAQLRDMGGTLVRTLDDVVNGSMVPRERLEAAARVYVSALRAHMRTEENEVLPAAERLLSATDWTDIDAAIAKFDDPLFGSEAHDRYARLRVQIERQALALRAR
jgi:hemerythrin-like domain-containing protein